LRGRDDSMHCRSPYAPRWDPSTCYFAPALGYCFQKRVRSSILQHSGVPKCQPRFHRRVSAQAYSIQRHAHECVVLLKEESAESGRSGVSVKRQTRKPYTNVQCSSTRQPQRPNRTFRCQHRGPKWGLLYPTSYSLTCSKEPRKRKLLCYCIFDKRARITESKVVEDVGWLATPSVLDHLARKNLPGSRGVHTYPRGSRRLALPLRTDGGSGGAAACRRACLLLDRPCK